MSSVIREQLEKAFSPTSEGKCFFMESFLKVDGKPLVLDDYQREIAFDESKYRIVNKSKKVGISTFLTAEALWYAMTNRNLDILFVATGERIAGELLERVKDHISSMPARIRPKFDTKVTKYSKTEIRFPNGARIISLPQNPKTLVGYGMRGKTFLYGDEYAFWEHDDELWNVIYPFALLNEGRITLVSTPRGKRGKFFEIAYPLQQMAKGLIEKKPTNWSYHEIPWHRCDRLRAKIGEIVEECGGWDTIAFRENHCAEFVDESISLFTWNLLNLCLVPDLEYYPNGYHSMFQLNFGVDLAKKNDETAIVLTEKVPKDKATPEHDYIVRHMYSFNKTDYTIQIPYIELLAKNFQGNPTQFKIDVTNNEFLYETLLKPESLGSLVHGYNFNIGLKEKLIMNLLNLMQNKRIKIPKEHPLTLKLLNQLHAVERSVTESGRAKYSGKSSGMDDFIWALALSVYDDYDSSGEVFAEVDVDDTMAKLNSDLSYRPYQEDEEPSESVTYV